MGGDLYLVDVAVSLEILKIHKAFVDVFRPAVAPKVGIKFRPTKSPLMLVLQMYEDPNQIGDRGMTYRMCVGCSWRDLTIRRQTASLTCTTGVRGTLSVQRRANVGGYKGWHHQGWQFQGFGMCQAGGASNSCTCNIGMGGIGRVPYRLWQVS